jgi:hypothetical protein
MNNLLDISKQLKNVIDPNEQFGHQILKIRRPRKRVPLWALDNKKIQQVILRAFPKMDSDPVQRQRAGRWTRVIHLYYRLKWSRGQIAKEMGLQYYTVNDLIRSIKRVAAGKRANGTGLRGQNPVGRPKKVR